MLLCTHCCIINRVLAFNLHLKFQLANERKCAVLQWRPWPMCIIGIGKMVAQRRTSLIPVTSGLQQVKWTNCCISNIIIQVYARHNQLNIDLLRNESGRATTPLSLMTGIQEAYSQPCREVGSTGLINTHTDVKRCCKPWMTCKNVLLIWWIVAGIIHGDLDISNFIFDEQVYIYTVQMP